MIFFFFKQKTAYEMRISDWSSDVCSSDLSLCLVSVKSPGLEPGRGAPKEVTCQHNHPLYPSRPSRTLPQRLMSESDSISGSAEAGSATGAGAAEIGRASCRERVSQYV